MEKSTTNWITSLLDLSPKSQHMMHRYFKLIRFAQASTFDGYTERHHIVPKSMGGVDDESNMVALTPRLHYLAHYLLWKAFRNRKMAFAFHVMIHGDPYNVRYSKLTSKSYELLVVECRELNRGSNHPSYGKKRSEESKVNQRLAVKGKKWTQERREKLSKSMIEYHRNNKRVVSDETKRKISDANRGKSKPFTEEHIAALNVHALNKAQLVCPHCGKQGQYANMKRWHFDNCKLNPTAP